MSTAFKQRNKNLVLVIFLLSSILFGMNISLFMPAPLVGDGGVLLAANTSSNSSGTKVYSAKLNNPISYDTGADLIGAIVKASLGIIGALAILVIVYGGVLYITSAGNEENIKKAKTAVTGAVIGLVVALLAYVIVDFVIKVLNK